MELNLFLGDCIDNMKNIPNRSIDMILCDPPYGTTSCKWDSIIPFEKMWEEINRIIKKNSAICLFGNEPFSSMLICSNLKGFKYRLDWDKKIPSGMAYAKYRPMQQTEDICIFTLNGEKSFYFPQKTKRETAIVSGGTKPSESIGMKNKDPNFKKVYEYKNPTSLIKFDKVRKGAVHPTQKPIPLLEYLIKSYSLEGDTILDFTMGSGSTGVACKNTKRNFIGIEKDEKYFNIAKQRIKDTMDLNS